MSKYGKLLMAGAAAMLLLSGCGEKKQDALGEAYACVARQEYHNAQQYFEEALITGADREETYRGMGLMYMGEGAYEKALDSFTKALESASFVPGDTEYDINYYMSVCYYKLGEYDDAIACYDAIIAMQGKSPHAYYLRGNMRLYLGDVEGAVGDFDSAVAAAKNDYGLCLDIYDALKQHGADDAATQYLDTVLSASVKDITDYDKGRLCYYKGEYAQACNYLERERGEKEADAEVIRLLGECYKLQGMYDYAAVVYSGYAEQYQDAQICNQMGLCYMEQGDYEKALEAFSKGLEIRENNTCIQTLKHNQIACYEYLHDYTTAASLLTEYIETYGGDADTEKELAFLKTR